MAQIRQFHNLTLAIAKADSNNVCYIIMPEGEKDKLLRYIDEASIEHGCSIVVLSGMNWNDDLTPWPAPGVFKEKKPFGGKAREFLKSLLIEYIVDIEQALGLKNPRRYLVGISLSGLFALWTITQTDRFAGIASISGSLWYDGFADYMQRNEAMNPSVKVHMSLGDREKKSKDERMSQVETITGQIANSLRQQNISVDYQIVEGTHFSPLIPRLEMALASILIDVDA